MGDRLEVNVIKRMVEEETLGDLEFLRLIIPSLSVLLFHYDVEIVWQESIGCWLVQHTCSLAPFLICHGRSVFLLGRFPVGFEARPEDSLLSLVVGHC